MGARRGELYFRAYGDQMMVVDVSGRDTLVVSKPRVLFTGRYFRFSGLPPQYDVARDGRFLMIEEPPTAEDPSQLILVHNWFEELLRKAPAR